MNLSIFDEMIQALRAELQEYGGLLALLEDQQNAILRGEPDAFLQLGPAVHDQVTLLGAHRSSREQIVRSFARDCNQPEASTVCELLKHMAQPVQGMIKALVDEINALIAKTQRRLRQNHLLLARCVSVAQHSVAKAGGGELISTYGRAGSVKHVVTGESVRLAVA